MMKLMMGTHSEIREFLIDYLENQLPALKKMQFRLHLVLCKDCDEYLRKYDSSIKRSRNFLNDPPPEELVNLTLKFLEDHRPPDEEVPDSDPLLGR